MSDVKGNVMAVVESIEQMEDAYGWLEDALDIEYIIGSDGSYRGARLLLTCGGPNIWVDTKYGRVEGYWWSDSYTESVDTSELDAMLEELYSCR